MMDEAAYQRRLACRGITRWDRPREAEPSYGMMARIASLHRQPSLGAFSRELGIENGGAFWQSCLDALCSSRFATEQDVKMLRHWTPIVEGSFVCVGGENLRRDDWTIRTRRFCPACLHESAHHRVWFDFTFMVNCPMHGMRLKDFLPGAAPLYWTFSCLDEHPGGGRLHAHSPRLVSVPDTLEAYVLGRMKIMPATANDLVDNYPVSDVIEAAELMGRLVVGGQRQSMPSIGSPGFEAETLHAAGYEVLRQGTDAVMAVFQEIAAQAPETAFGSRMLFGWANFNFSFKSNLALHLRGYMQAVAGQLGRHGRNYGIGAIIDGECLTIREIGSKLRTSPNSIAAVAKMRSLYRPHTGTKGSPLLVHRDNIEEITSIITRSLSRTDAVQYLGITKQAFAEIVHAGHIEKLGARWGDDGPEDRFEIGVLSAFVDRIPVKYARCTPRHPATTVMLAEHIMTLPEILDHAGYDAGDFFSAVFSGDLIVSQRTGLTHGLRDFRVVVSDQPWKHPFTARCLSLTTTREQTARPDTMSQRQACALLDINPDTAKALADLGYLPVAYKKARKSRQKLDAAGVFRFGDTYVAGKLYAEILKCNPSKVQMCLAKLGVKTLLEQKEPHPFRGRKLNPIYDRQTLRKVLDLKRDPDAIDEARVGWKKMAKWLGENKSQFMIWQVYDDDTALFCTSDRLWPIKVRYIFDSQPVCEGLKGEMTYTIQAEINLNGEQASGRVRAIAARLKSRAIHRGVSVSHVPQSGRVSAHVRAIIVNRIDNGLRRGEIINDFAEEDIRTIHRMLHMIKSALEDGPRNYNAKAFGIWPNSFYRS